MMVSAGWRSGLLASRLPTAASRIRRDFTDSQAGCADALATGAHPLVFTVGAAIDGGVMVSSHNTSTSNAALVRAHHRLPYSAVARFTLTRLEESQLRISQLAGWSIFWLRACTILPPPVLYGGAMTSQSLVPSARRSPT